MKLDYPEYADKENLLMVTNSLVNKYKYVLDEMEIYSILNGSLNKAMERWNPNKGCLGALYNITGRRHIINAIRYNHEKKRFCEFPIPLDKVVDERKDVSLSDIISNECKATYESDFKEILVESGLDELSVELLLLRYSDNKGFKDIAKELKLTIQAVDLIHQLALEYIKEFIKPEALYPSKRLGSYSNPFYLGWNPSLNEPALEP